MINLPDDTGVRGASACAASRRRLKGSFFSASFVATDSLSKGVALAATKGAKGVKDQAWAPDSDVLDLVFAQDMPLPASVTRTYNRAELKKLKQLPLNLTVTEQTPDGFKRALPLGDPLRRVDEMMSVETRIEYEVRQEGWWTYTLAYTHTHKHTSPHVSTRTQLAKEVTLEFVVNEGGLLHVSNKVFKSTREVSEKKGVMRHIGKVRRVGVAVVVMSWWPKTSHRFSSSTTPVQKHTHTPHAHTRRSCCLL